MASHHALKRVAFYLLLGAIGGSGAGDAALQDLRSTGSMTETLRIGNAEGEGPAAFADIRPPEVDRPGRIYVLEYQAPEIRVFDARARRRSHDRAQGTATW